MGAKHIKKAAKNARQKATKNGAEGTMEDTSQLECTYTSCTAGVGGAPFKTPALIPEDALAYLGLHRESTHGDNAKDAAQEHQTSLDDVPNLAASGPEKDVQPAQQDQQPSRITCTVIQTAAKQAAVAR